MINKIYPCLWFDGQAKAAADFYCSIFDNAKILTDTPMVVQFEIEGEKVMGLNGGPMFKINPSISFFVTCASEEEIDNTWKKLTDGGSVMMGLDKYPWSEKYGWGVDKFGMTWQLMLGQIPAGGQKIMLDFLFVGNKYGRGEEAVKYYTSLIPDSKIQDLQIYQKGASMPEQEGKLMFGNFVLGNTQFAAMDGFGNHEFDFNEAVSLVLECDTQEEIDLFWNELTKEGKESMCGWLVDKFGISWQIIPKILGKLMSDPEKAPRVMQAVMKMKKLDIATLQNA